MPDGAARIATLSLRDYADDLVELVASLNSAPLLATLPGRLLVQLVAARTRHIGVVARPSPVGPVV
ncbi:lysophospholipase domain protein [Mycobacterium ulcerans str. Harvey]|uniref:Lysophospholipase domain protein n=1 Tax=Mycobacterium ulcerans str. Harvey TaxID=1299332 RepID=A0ABN0R0Q7_MYCUL|nr:lysophospholipase domain protein [Mycobacterium ulcerans str. Harvey]